MTQNKRIFIAGAAGAIGRRLCPLLISEGWHVTGTTRFPEKAATLRAMGVEPVVVDVFDEAGLRRAVSEARPDTVINQLTDLPPGLALAKMPLALLRTARLRNQGAQNLIAAAVAAKAARMIVQSLAFVYAPGPRPYREDAPLRTRGLLLGAAGRNIEGLEGRVLQASLVGIILRYGKFYGPGTGCERSSRGAAVHVDAAADAARRAVTAGSQGVYNIAEDDGNVSIAKAVRELGWHPGFRI